MTNYYFLASLLPSLEIGHLPALGFAQLKELMKVNLSSTDQKIVRDFLRRIDLENFRAYWCKEPLDPRGNLSREEIEQSLSDRVWPNDEPFPSFLTEFLDKYHEDQARANHFALLMSQYWQYESQNANPFIAEYSHFQRELHFVLMGFRAKNVGRDIVHELQYEDSREPIIAQLIAQKDAKIFEPPFEFKELKPIFEEFSEQPLELYKAFYRYQFDQIIERWGNHLFSIERILSYLARLLLVEKWLELDMQQGMQIIDTVEGKIR